MSAAFAAVIQDAREDAGLSYRALAAELNEAGCDLSLAALHSICVGSVRRPPRPEIVAALATALSLPVESLVVALYGPYSTTE